MQKFSSFWLTIPSQNTREDLFELNDAFMEIVEVYTASFAAIFQRKHNSIQCVLTKI